jgi:hypothetical protein
MAGHDHSWPTKQKISCSLRSKFRMANLGKKKVPPVSHIAASHAPRPPQLLHVAAPPPGHLVALP